MQRGWCAAKCYLSAMLTSRASLRSCSNALWRLCSVASILSCAAGSCLRALAAVATVLPGRTLAEAGSSAALRTEAAADDDAMAEDDRREDGDTAMPCLLRLSRLERRLGRYPVTGGFLRLMEALLSRRCTDTQLQVRRYVAKCKLMATTIRWSRCATYAHRLAPVCPTTPAAGSSAGWHHC